MSTTLDELATFLTNAGLSNIQKGQIQPTPDACTVIYEYGGLAPDHVFGQSAIEIEHPRVQIACRGIPGDYAGPRARAETAYRAMAAASAQSISSTRYLTMEPIQPPFLIDRDRDNRILVGFNCQISKALSA